MDIPPISWWINTTKSMINRELQSRPDLIFRLGHYQKHFLNWCSRSYCGLNPNLEDAIDEYEVNVISNRIERLNMVIIPSQQGYAQKKVAVFLALGSLSVLLLYTGICTLLSYYGISDTLFGVLFVASHYLIALVVIVFITAMLIVFPFKNKHNDNGQKKYNPKTASNFLVYFRSIRNAVCNKFSLISKKIKYVISLINDGG